MALTKESVIEALKTIIGPNGNDIVTGGEVRALSVDGNNVVNVYEGDYEVKIFKSIQITGTNLI